MQCPVLMGGAPLLEVTNLVFGCGQDHNSVFPYGRSQVSITGG